MTRKRRWGAGLARTGLAVACALAVFAGLVASTAAAGITVAPTSGPSGAPIDVLGTGFKKRSAITITVDGAAVSTTPSSCQTGDQGDFACAIVGPTGGEPGSRTIAASDGKDAASASFSVVAPALTPTLSPTSIPPTHSPLPAVTTTATPTTLPPTETATATTPPPSATSTVTPVPLSPSPAPPRPSPSAVPPIAGPPKPSPSAVPPTAGPSTPTPSAVPPTVGPSTPTVAPATSTPTSTATAPAATATSLPAETETATPVSQPGGPQLRLPDSVAFAAQLTGDDLVVDAPLGSVQVSGNLKDGWHLDIGATPFVAGGRALPPSALRVVDVVLETSGAPANGVGYPLTVPTDGSSARLVSVAPSSTTGPQQLTLYLSLFVPADAYVGDYTATITITGATGP